MATQVQIDFVENVEQAIRGLCVQSKTPPTISAIMTDAGYGATDLFAIVTRLKEAGERDLVGRLRTAFERAKKMPLCLEDVEPLEKPKAEKKNDQEPGLRLLNDEEIMTSSMAPPAGTIIGLGTPAYVRAPRPEVKMDPSDIEVFTRMLTLLEPIESRRRSRMLTATCVFYKVGE